MKLTPKFDQRSPGLITGYVRERSMKTELGQRGFEVEWAYELPLNEFGDADLDAAKYKRVIVETIKRARQLAREVWPQTNGVLGVVQITPVELVDPFGDNLRSTFRWEACGDSEFYEGEG